jgi:Opioid growth factor receptor (OGFr) conserved region
MLTGIRSDILLWDHAKLESYHDYIQILFPLPEESGITDAPIIDRQVFEAFRSRPELRSKLRESFKKMLWFYGFDLDAEGDSIKVIPRPTQDRHA